MVVGGKIVGEVLASDHHDQIGTRDRHYLPRRLRYIVYDSNSDEFENVWTMPGRLYARCFPYCRQQHPFVKSESPTLTSSPLSLIPQHGTSLPELIQGLLACVFLPGAGTMEEVRICYPVSFMG